MMRMFIFKGGDEYMSNLEKIVILFLVLMLGFFSGVYLVGLQYQDLKEENYKLKEQNFELYNTLKKILEETSEVCTIKSFSIYDGYTYTGNCKSIIESINEDKKKAIQEAVDKQYRIGKEAVDKSICYIDIIKDEYGFIKSVYSRGSCKVNSN